LKRVNALLKKSLFVTLAAACAPVVFGGQPKAAPVKPALPVSTFTMPSGPREGRDPFFPESTRPYEENKPTPTGSTLASDSFSVKGLSVEHGHPMVIINNHTFAVGDEGDVLTSAGHVHLRLVQIQGNTAIIQANGLRRELPITLK
jgi:hypothetical protein